MPCFILAALVCTAHDFSLQDIESGERGAEVVELTIRGKADIGIDFGYMRGAGGVKPLFISAIRPG